jgi:hypothetical protein
MRVVPACVFAALLACTSCLTYPDTSERLADDIVLTRFDSNASFASYSTFAIRPEVALVGEAESSTVLDEAAASMLVEAVARNMISQGYVRAASTSTADLGLEISVTTKVNTRRDCYSSGYYRGYGTGSAYWGYSGYSYYAPYACTTTAWTSGSVVLDLLDLRAAAANPAPAASGAERPLNAIWLGVVYRVLSSTAPENLALAASGIDQAFRQSPYLRARSN